MTNIVAGPPSRPAPRRFHLVALIVAALTVAACSDDGLGAASGGYSVLGALDRIPAAFLDDPDASGRLELRTGDLTAATEAAGVARPDDPREPDDVAPWLLALAGRPNDGAAARVALPLPQVMTMRGIEAVADMEDELGFAFSDVATYTEATSLPLQLTVYAGDIAPDERLVELGSGLLTLGEGDDFTVDGNARSSLRPLGRPLRVAAADGAVVTSPSTPLVEAWLAGGATLADEERFAETAAALDEIGVVGAYLVETASAGSGSSTPAVDESQVADPFDVVGLGWNADDDGALGVVVYHFDSADLAAANVARLEAAYLADSLFDRGPIADRVTLEEVRPSGDTVIATVRFPDESGPSILLDLLFRADVIFLHR